VIRVGRAKNRVPDRSSGLDGDFALLGELEALADEVIEDLAQAPRPHQTIGHLGFHAKV